MVLPLEPSFYWVSTNNGDDNQLFSAMLEEADGDFFGALKRAVEIAPAGAKELGTRRRHMDAMAAEDESGNNQMRKFVNGSANAA